MARIGLASHGKLQPSLAWNKDEVLFLLVVAQGHALFLASAVFAVNDV